MNYYFDFTAPISWRLLMLRSDWGDTAPSVAHTFETLAVEGLTGVESRAPSYEAYRIRLTQTFIMPLDEAAALRLMLGSIGEMRLGLPLWMDDLPASSYLSERIYASQYYVSYDVNGNVAINSLAYPKTVGLVVGRLVDLPAINPINGTDARVTFTLQEDSPWAMRVGTNASAPSSFIFQPDWSALVDESKWRIESTPIGHGREAAISGQESYRKLGQEADLVLMSRTEIAQLIAFFEAHRGSHGSFTMPIWYNPLSSSASDVTGHFGDDTLTLDYATPAYANCHVVLWEQLSLVPGSPAQERPGRAWLYMLQFEGGTPNYYTSYEKPLTLGTVAYTPTKISHSAMDQSLKPESDKMDLTMDGVPGCPLLAFVLLELERKLALKVWECDPANPETAVVIFDGDVISARSQGRVITAEASTMGNIMSRSIPRHQVQTTCNYSIGDALCGKDMTALKVTGSVVAITGSTVDVACSNSSANEWFTQGWALFGSGSGAERRAILKSTVISRGQRLLLHKPLKQTGTIAVQFYPGCDGQYSTCGSKFSNAVNFGGFPFTPGYIETVATGFKPKMGK